MTSLTVCAVSDFGIRNLDYNKIRIWVGPKKSLYFQATGTNLEVDEAMVSPLRSNDVARLSRDLIREVDGIATTKKNPMAAFNGVKAIGQRLYREVLPSGIKSFLNGLSKQALLEIQFEGIDMPIELFCREDDDYLARQFRVARLSTASLEQLRRSLSQQIDATKWVLSMAGDKLTDIRTAIETFLRRNPFGDYEINDDIDSLGDKWKDAKCVWVTSHGAVDESGPLLLLTESFKLRPISIDPMPPVARQAFVFVNACNAGQVLDWGRGTENFGKAFHAKGAGTFVSVSTLVPQEFAQRFGQQLMERAAPGTNALDAVFVTREADETDLDAISRAEDHLFRATYRIFTNLNQRELQTMPTFVLSSKRRIGDAQ